jgi:perosamine synthetase
LETKIYYTKPSISTLEVSYALDAVQNGWGEKCYDYIDKFEEKFKKYLNVNYAIATSSCTGALHMGLASLGITIGDEIIVADTNWIATISPIIHLGATPIFVDILENSWCIDPNLVEKAITPKTKAIIAVHLYGNLCDMDALLAIGAKYEIPVIEDSAEAIGSIYKGKRAGSLGTFSTFSFHGSKTITTGEGGMFVTNDESLYEKVLTLSNHGRTKIQVKQFWPEVIGYKYKLSNVQAAIGCAQLERIEELVNQKREILKYYKNKFQNFPFVSMNPEDESNVNGAWMPTVVFDKQLNLTYELVRDALKKENIDARPFFSPISSLPPFSSNMNNSIAYDLPKRSINLPSFHEITFEQQDKVISIIINLLRST